jgi:hypothetical protein
MSDSESSSESSSESVAASESATRKYISWSTDMENYLLELRLSKYKDLFKDAKEKTRIRKGWKNVRKAFNKKYKVNATEDKVKNKFQSLKSSYRDLKGNLEATGNSVKVVLPSNWTIMVEFFEGRPGMSAKNLGESTSAGKDIKLEETEDDPAEDEKPLPVFQHHVN